MRVRPALCLVRLRGPATLRSRLRLLFAGLIAAIAISIFLLFPGAIERQAIRGIENKAESIATLAAHSVGPSLVFQDRDGMRAALLGGIEIEDVIYVRALDTEGELLTAVSGRGLSHSPRRPAEVLTTAAPVAVGDRLLGSVDVALSLNRVYEDVDRARFLVTFVSLAVFLVGLLLVDLISRRVTGPLEEVTDTAERIARGDVESRAPMSHSAEVGRLAGSFNQMLDVLRETQMQLTSAQKMESIGRLAGGVAHDFNNLLTTIGGNAELVLTDLPESSPLRDEVGEISEAARQAAGLTQQLLAFSRRQVIQPVVLDLNEVVSSTQTMLNRLIGEDVRLSSEFLGHPLAVRADRSQLEQVLMNLVVNGRDAMPYGGTLGVRVGRVELDTVDAAALGEGVGEGTYAVLTVSDSGSGMSKETQARMFEPFYTEKPVGHGTGLGLATVYGIVTQSGGFIRVYSELGMGTTFKIFLPLVADAIDLSSSDARANELTVGGQETILVVEDEEGVRNVTKKILARCGYTVLLAATPKEGMRIATEHEGPIHLLLTDVIMPEVSGPEMVEVMAEVRPHMCVLYMSGYTDDQLAHHGVLEDGVQLVEKPFTAHHIALRVTELLKGPQAAPPVRVAEPLASR